MAPPPLISLYTITFFLAFLVTTCVAASLRVLAILPHGRFQKRGPRRRLDATRVLIVLGSGGHTHEMFYLLRDLDTTKYTHRTYIVTSGDAFSAGRAAEFEQELEKRKKRQESEQKRELPHDTTGNEKRTAYTGPECYNIVHLPRARRIHQSLLTTPFSSLHTLLSTFSPLLSAPLLLPDQLPQSPQEAAAQDLPDLIITNGPATGVIVVLAALILRFFDFRGANSRGKCKTVYVESFARVTSLSLSGKLLVKVVDRFLVQWPQLEKAGGRAEFWGVLV
jgi:beta-1,4-N-acetylglucosaminyltransferase